MDAAESGADLRKGIALTQLAEGHMVAGHVGDDPALLVRRGDKVYAIGATCTHYGAPLIEGLLVDETIRCPWHHACFRLSGGAAIRPPALNDLACWRVEESGGLIFVRERLQPRTKPMLAPTGLPDSVVIVGGGAAATVAAETLRREGYAGPITMVSADADAPYDRPALSKDFLAGHAEAAWIPLHTPQFYAEHQINLRLGTRVTSIDTAAKELQLDDGERLNYDALLLATGAEPIRLDIAGAELPHVHMLRSFRDCQSLLARIETVRHCVIIGASFIGLEVAAALRQRNIDVHVVAPDTIPMARIVGPAIGEMVTKLHQSKGVIFHLGTKPTAIHADSVSLANGEILPADLVVVGIGVRPATALAEAAGLAMDRGVLVDEFLETSAEGVFAAGDIARWPDRHSGERLRVEHWIVAERQGQVAARNILGQRESFDAVPFFWTQHYDVSIDYLGHAETWDAIDIDGDVDAQSFVATFMRAGRKLAVVSAGRDRDTLLAEVAFESESSR
jgi:NADPH-dependent 2,4-dienoyl-CoA reductase/sulfur reductase-like enzyme/nitrite reductase/ring-hydroxylating ferredoxin subunit